VVTSVVTGEVLPVGDTYLLIYASVVVAAETKMATTTHRYQLEPPTVW
jgi:hypothetical protein